MKEQLRLLAMQDRLDKLKKNLPPTVGLPSSLAFSAIGKASTAKAPTTLSDMMNLNMPVMSTANTVPTVDLTGGFPPTSIPSFTPFMPPPFMGLPPPGVFNE